MSGGVDMGAGVRGKSEKCGVGLVPIFDTSHWFQEILQPFWAAVECRQTGSVPVADVDYGLALEAVLLRLQDG